MEYDMEPIEKIMDNAIKKLEKLRDNIKIGYIRIQDKKICFEYYELEIPQIDISEHKFSSAYEDAWQEYYASKRIIEVSNAFNSKIGLIKDGQPCEAEISKGKATIIKLIK